MHRLILALILLCGFLSRPAAAQFSLPKFDEDKIVAAGIRKVEGKYLVLYTDLPVAAEIDELPKAFDAAVPLWCAYFGVPAANAVEWKIAGCVIQDKERFLRCGLLPPDLPEFLHGFTRGSQLWLYEQPSGYYRRHLLLHEGTHAFMARWLGGAGPPWYMEGIAELLATHHWQKGQLTLDVMPQSKEEMPYWGRIKLVKEENAAGRGMTLEQIIRYDATAHRRNEPYAWCWAATAFLDRHPLTQAAFRELKTHVKDRSLDFSLRFIERLKKDWPAITEDWQLFVADCDYGYDIARAAVVRKPAAMLPADGGKATIAADRGWQSTGMRLEAGKTYTLTAAGRYAVGKVPKPWICEPAGVTIRYYHGQPLGKLLAALSDLEGEPTTTPLAQPQPIGMGGELSPGRTGTLYLKINEAASGLADNSGTLEVSVRAMP
jgi:hypothetical protein